MPGRRNSRPALAEPGPLPISNVLQLKIARKKPPPRSFIALEAPSRSARPTYRRLRTRSFRRVGINEPAYTRRAASTGRQTLAAWYKPQGLPVDNAVQR